MPGKRDGYECALAADGSEAVSIVEASSAGVKDMADGSLRITFEFEPRFAQAAFALFGVRGRAVAIAALKYGSGAIGSAAAPEPVPEEKPKGGALARLAGMWCNDPAFCAWLTERGDFARPLDSAGAADVVRAWCYVSSRAELDSQPAAAEHFNKHIREPYRKHLESIGVAA